MLKSRCTPDREWLEAAAELDELVAEPLSHVEARQRQAFDQLSSSHGPMVVYGSGSFGRRLATTMQVYGEPVVALCDRDPGKWGANVDGLPVLSLREAAGRFGKNGLFILGLANPGRSCAQETVAAELKGQGCRRVTLCASAPWKYSAALLLHDSWDLPSKMIEDTARVRAAFRLMPDPLSARVFVHNVRWRLTGDGGCLPISESHTQYLPEDVHSRLDEECFVDSGAYDGDTISSFRAVAKDKFCKLIAFEADPASFALLGRMVENTGGGGDERIQIYPFAVGAEPGTVRFSGSGEASAAISRDGNILVECVALNEILDGSDPTFIKLDIEGAESSALQGARGIVNRQRALLAVCLYHCPDHLWFLPLAIRETAGELEIALRQYDWSRFDLVCHAVPPDRSMLVKAGHSRG